MVSNSNRIYITFPMRMMIDNEADGIMKFTEDFFRSKAAQFNEPIPLRTIRRFATYETAIKGQGRSKSPFLIFKITKQDTDQAIHPEEIEGLYCQTPLGKYQFIKNPLS